MCCLTLSLLCGHRYRPKSQGQTAAYHNWCLNLKDHVAFSRANHSILKCFFFIYFILFFIFMFHDGVPVLCFGIAGFGMSFDLSSVLLSLSLSNKCHSSVIMHERHGLWALVIIRLILSDFLVFPNGGLVYGAWPNQTLMVLIFSSHYSFTYL